MLFAKEQGDVEADEAVELEKQLEKQVQCLQNFADHLFEKRLKGALRFKVIPIESHKTINNFNEEV